MELEKKMLHDMDLTTHLWEEAARIDVYLKNHTPHRVLYNKTLKEAFLGEKPEIIHPRVFGCLVYIHIPKEERTKLDPPRRKGILIGQSNTSKAYRIYFPGFKNIDIIIDVTFDEDSTYSISSKVPIKEIK